MNSQPPTVSLNEVACAKFREMGDLYMPDLAAFSNKTVLITGATGFFGSWLLALFDSMNQAGIAVKVLAVSRNPDIFLSAEKRYSTFRWLTWVRCDLGLNADPLLSIKQCDYILHAATDTSIPASGTRAWQIVRIWQNIIEASRRLENPKILLVSSGAVYGTIPETGAQDDQPWVILPHVSPSAYSIGKRFCEESAFLESSSNSARIVVARCFSFVGPGLPLNEHFAIGNFVRDIIAYKDIRIKGDGQAVRSYMHIADLCNWLLILLLRGKTGEAYNVGSELPISMKELAEMVKQFSNKNSTIHIDGKPSVGLAPSTYFPRTSKAQSIGLRETQTLLDGLREMIAYATAKRHSKTSN